MCFSKTNDPCHRHNACVSQRKMTIAIVMLVCLKTKPRSLPRNFSQKVTYKHTKEEFQEGFDVDLVLLVLRQIQEEQHRMLLHKERKRKEEYRIQRCKGRGKAGQRVPLLIIEKSPVISSSRHVLVHSPTCTPSPRHSPASVITCNTTAKP